MKRTLKIGAVISIISITSIIVAGVVLNEKKIPLKVVFTEPTFEGLKIDVSTDKDVYAIGEKIEINVSLTNTNNYDMALSCYGWMDSDNDELYSLFDVTIYDENYTKIWYRAMPDKNELNMKKTQNHSSSDENVTYRVVVNKNSIKNNQDDARLNYPRYYPTSYTLNLNASSKTTYNNITTWNQTAKNIRVKVDNVTLYDFNKQVPPGTYIISITVPLNMQYTSVEGYKEFYFGNSKTITII